MDADKNLADLGSKLRLAREAVGKSTRHACRLLPVELSVSHVTLSNYESGRSRPSLAFVAAIADVYERPVNWFLQDGRMLSGVHYRNRKSKVRVRDLNQFEAIAQKWLEAYRQLDAWSGTHRRKKLLPINVSSGAEAAMEIRTQLHLAEDTPIESVISILEMAGVRVIELPTDLAIDAMAGKLGSEDVVVLNSNVPNERGRLNAAHELGHVLFRDCDRMRERSHAESEKRAFEFASHLLLTRRMLRKAFLGRSMVRLVQFKERYGISLAAMIYRAQGEEILPKHLAKHLWVEFARRGWRNREPGQVREDRAVRFEQLLDAVILNDRLTWSQAGVITGLREDELRDRVNKALGTEQVMSAGRKGGDTGPFFRLID